MIKILLIFLLYSFIFGDEQKKDSNNTKQILECNLIFEARKDEIKESIRALNEKTQNLEAYKNATENLLEQKQNQLKEKENILNAKFKQIEENLKQIQHKNEQEKKAIEELIAKNEQILQDIKTASANKVAKTFSGMKDSKAAPIISELEDMQAAEILSSLSSSEMSKILAKMDPKRAAELTKIIQKGPPFQTSEHSVQNHVAKSQPNNEQDEKNQLEFQKNGGF